jgi:hypothetical protein
MSEGFLQQEGYTGLVYRRESQEGYTGSAQEVCTGGAYRRVVQDG